MSEQEGRGARGQERRGELLSAALHPGSDIRVGEGKPFSPLPLKKRELLQRAYALVAELWCSPQDVEVEQVREQATDLLSPLREVDGEAADHLARFLAHYPPVEETYVELFELNPRCPLYLGSHAFDEPKTCAQAAVSDRNEYMIELIAIYKHFGLGLNGRELPDYLPLMVEFLALTAESEDPIREKFIREFMLPFLPPLRQRLEALTGVYLHLADGLEGLLKLDLQARGPGDLE